ncbi:MAG: YtxH domain-containing protein [Rubricoccaceae bacterium]
MSSRSRTLQASILGLFVGGGVGFTLGLLLAPDEGRALRRRAAYLFDRWAEDLAGFLDRLDSDAAASDARARADALVEDARAQAAALLDEAEALMSEARQRRADDRPAG